MKLLTKQVRRRLPRLYETEAQEDPIAVVRFFAPDSSWVWYATEFDGEDVFFGLVRGLVEELGYFRLSDLRCAKGPLGLFIERDKWFEPTPLSKLSGRRAA